uniref:Uncharacterized protein n=1 Tax=Picea glauca TaxID=3330 RepID=A0A101M3Q6_PICGL|nr:hypothetical protein ABT39_MTgene283 [Picea glauca]
MHSSGMGITSGMLITDMPDMGIMADMLITDSPSTHGYATKKGYYVGYASHAHGRG